MTIVIPLTGKIDTGGAKWPNKKISSQCVGRNEDKQRITTVQNKIKTERNVRVCILASKIARNVHDVSI